MRLKTIAFVVFLSVLGVIISSYFVGSVLTAQVIAPFSTLSEPGDIVEPTIVTPDGSTGVNFLHAEIQQGWIPWIIKQASILIGGLSLIVFVYAGISLILNGDNEEALGKSMKMLIYGIVGIALAAFSYTIIANVLLLL